MLQTKIEIKNAIKAMENEQKAQKAILHKDHHSITYSELWQTQNAVRNRSSNLFVLNCAWYVVKHRLCGDALEEYKKKVYNGTNPNKEYRWDDYSVFEKYFWNRLIQPNIDNWTSLILRELDEKKVSE